MSNHVWLNYIWKFKDNLQLFHPKNPLHGFRCLTDFLRNPKNDVDLDWF